MFIIVCYDVNAKRVNKYHRILSKYLVQVQESVFDGDLSDAKYLELKSKISKIKIDPDQVVFYEVSDYKLINKIGGNKDFVIIH